MVANLDRLLADIRGCRICVERPRGHPLPHEPRPVVRARSSARMAVCGQAPGTRVHASGIPFLDPSGDRLRDWMGVSPDEFYDETRVAIVPMGFCFPGLDGKGADLPPRPECAPAWRAQTMAELPNLELVLVTGQYALRWHLKSASRGGLTVAVRDWRAIFERDSIPRLIPLPHPSWRNNAWIKRNPWFEAELLPVLRADVRRIFSQS